MTGFELLISGVGSNRSTNCAITTAPCLSNVQVRMGVTKRSRTRSLRFIFLIATPSSQRVKPNRRNVEIVMNFAIGKKRVTVLAKPNVRPEPYTQVP